MKAKQRLQVSDPEYPCLDIAPLIDVCFLLLIYFIATTTIVPAERELDMKLPGPPNRLSTELIEPLLIKIESNGLVSTGTDRNLVGLDGDPDSRELPLLDSHLAMMNEMASASGGELVVQVEVSEECHHQRVIDVLNALAKAGVETVVFRDLISGV